MLPKQYFKITETVKLFPQKGGWFYISVPKKFTDISKEYADRGLVPITAKHKDYEWNTSLLPMGDGTHFIALNAKVRKIGNIKKGDKITLEFKFRV